MTDKTRVRLHFIDFARSYAVVLALLSHGLVTTDVFTHLGDDSLYIRMFTRTATPMFVFMFGFMLEFVYASRARESGMNTVRKRLYARSFQCYVCFGLTCLCAILGGYKEPLDLPKAMMFFGNSRFGNILRVYAVILALAPLLIRCRIRFGIRCLVIALVVVTASSPFLLELKSVDFGVLNNPLNVTFGIGPYTRGPSIWHSFIFVLAGMLTASSLSFSPPGIAALHRFYLYSAYLISACIVAWVLLIRESPVEAMLIFAEGTYRGNNMPGYYIIGTIASLLTLMLCGLAIGTHELPRVVRSLFLPVGLASLTAYTVGNVLLNLFGAYSQRSPAAFLAIFFCAVVAIVKYVDRVPFYGWVNEIMHFRMPAGARQETP